MKMETEKLEDKGERKEGRGRDLKNVAAACT